MMPKFQIAGGGWSDSGSHRIIVTPIRFGVWFLFLGTAYQLIIRQYMGRYRCERRVGWRKSH
jgi:hypothetical protein